MAKTALSLVAHLPVPVLLLLLGLPHGSHQQDPTLNITRPLEGRAGENLMVTCTISSSSLVSGVTLIYTNGSNYGGVAVSRRDNEAIFILQSVPQNLNGTDLACSFQEFTSNASTVLLFSRPVFADGTSIMSFTRVVREGGGEVINVTVMEYPPSVVSITRDGQVVPQGSSITATTAAITITNVNRRDTGLYVVTYTNSEGGATVYLNLTVLYPPTFSDTVTDNFICDVSSSPVTCAAQIGSAGTLRCDFDAFPEATLMIQSPAGSRAIRDTQAATITLSGAGTEDAGTYNCTAMNSVSTSTRSISLAVGTTPSDVTDVRAVPNDDSVVITWSYMRAGDALPLSNFSIVIKRANEDPILYSETAPAESRTWTVSRTDLPASGSFAASVNPVNMLGSGEGLDTTFVLEVPTTPTMPSTTTNGALRSVSSSGYLLLVIALTTLICTFFKVH